MSIVQTLRVDAEMAPRLNFAMAHNAVPVLRGVEVANDGPGIAHSVKVSAELSGGASERWTAQISEIAPGGTWRPEELSLRLVADRLVNTEEREQLELIVTVQADGVEPVETRKPFELLAYNEWDGTSGLPELLAAFVLPNDPAVGEVLAAARDGLVRAGRDPALNGYQSRDPVRVRQLAEAVYEAVQSLGVTYVNPPSSFEKTGQKVRTPGQVLEHKMGTCLDLTLLLAASLEQMGLNPLLFIVEGHAFPGVWLSDDQLPDPASDALGRVRNLIKLGEFLVFDSSAVASRPVVPFERAEAAARQNLADDAAFLYFVDTRAARHHRILPLPARVSAGEYVAAEQPVILQVTGSRAAPDGLAPPSQSDPAEVAQGPRRIEVWKQRLLDLSLRNRLLNFREGRSALVLLCDDIAGLEDELAEGQKFVLDPQPSFLSERDPRAADVLEGKTGDDPRAVYLAERLAQGRLTTSLSSTDLDARLTRLAREARSAMEEGGGSTLYLALGFLRWFESPSSSQPRMAPLLLLPVELARRSARDPYQLRRVDEDVRINATLIEKLNVDFDLDLSELHQLPIDHSGVDVPLVLATARRALTNFPRWEVVDTAAIAHFSFTKYLMWRDLADQADALMQNAVVRHLIAPLDGGFADPYEGAAAEGEPGPAEVEEALCPLDADGSQLEAVVSAVRGQTFVLHGPPGTGKSQTISNLIAQCMAAGKTVLFVSEKRAALDVVHRRLTKVGLGPFCLELHSNKSRKKAVYEQLKAALSAMGSPPAADWELGLHQLRDLRGELDAWVGAMHRDWPGGLTARASTAALIGLAHAPRVPLALGSAEEFTAERLAALRGVAARLASSGALVAPVAECPWLGCDVSEWSPELETRVEQGLAAVQDAAQALEDKWATLQDLGLAVGARGRKDLDRLLDLARLLLEAPVVRPDLLREPDWEGVCDATGRAVRAGQEEDALRAGLSERYVLGLFETDIEGLRQRLSRWVGRFAPLAWIMLWPVRRALKPQLQPQRKLASAQTLKEDLDAAAKARGLEQGLEQSRAEQESWFGRLWTRREWDAVERALAWAGGVRRLVSSLRAGKQGDGGGGDLRARVIALVTDGRDDLGEGGPVRSALDAFVAAGENFLSRRDALASDLREPPEAGTDASDHLLETRAVAAARSAAMGALRDWCLLATAAADARRLGLGPVVDALLGGEVAPPQVPDVVERGVHTWWLAVVTGADPSLKGFHGVEHHRKIAQFVEVDRGVLEAAPAVLGSRLAERLPAMAGAASSSEVGVLRRELQKQRRHLPVRRLFRSIPNLLPRLKPCVLMSPLSIAQYLEPGGYTFDLVVFDEASQIPTHDAIGAIARGKQVVVVGDSKQLPPTSFFQRGVDEEAPVDEEDVEELESILDECVAAGLPSRRLRWHYRSRHESLISFSNHHYYENGLVTFPSAALMVEGRGVSWVHVAAGHYDKGKSRTNRAEAEAVVAETKRRLLDPATRDRSVGIVTFSVAQQTLIEDLFDAERRAEPELDRFFGAAVNEPVFVKNLENVQGDERDIMFFSICYGPDRFGRVAMNFGPLNRTGGERRLNVAVTRARFELVVFSTLQAHQIDLSRTRAVGVRHLKAFLEYAALGTGAIPETSVAGPGTEFDSPFEAEVYAALVDRGWPVDTQVGCAGYRIDLGVKDPDQPGRYLLGVECDGASYHSAATARERDRLRADVLRGLGWTLHRIWSTDWWRNPERELQRLDEALQGLQAGAGMDTAAGANAGQADGQGDDHVGDPEPLAEVDGDAPPTAPMSPIGVPYVAAQCPASEVADPEEFHDPRQTRRIAQLLFEVVGKEAPIHVKVAARRIAPVWAIQRITKRVLRRLQEALESLPADSRPQQHGEFLWADGQSPDEFHQVRTPVPGQHDSARAAQEIPPEELAAAACQMLELNIALSRDDLARETAKVFGITRLGTKVRAAVDAGIELLISRGQGVADGDRVALPPR